MSKEFRGCNLIDILTEKIINCFSVKTKKKKTWCLNVIGVLSELPLMVIDKIDMGKTKGARPSNKSKMTMPKIPMDVLKIEK